VTAAPGDGQLAGATLALVRDRYEAEFRRSLTARGLTARTIDRVTGLDYSTGGEQLNLILFRLEPG